jgi:hypothetical protein
MFARDEVEVLRRSLNAEARHRNVNMTPMLDAFAAAIGELYCAFYGRSLTWDELVEIIKLGYATKFGHEEERT